jgi:PKD repeat protein
LQDVISTNIFSNMIKSLSKGLFIQGFFLTLLSLLCTKNVVLAQSNCNFTISNPNPCPGEMVTLSVNSPLADHKYTFKFTPGLSPQVGNIVTTTFPFSSSQNTYLVVLLDSLNGAQVCTSTQPVTVKASPDLLIGLVPQANVSLINNIIATCTGIPLGGLEVKIKNNTPNSTMSQNVSYKINWGDGSMEQTFTNANFGIVPHTYQNNGYYPILITVTHSNGCVRNYTYSFFSGSNPAVGLGNLGNSINLCPPTSKLFPVSEVANNAPGTIYRLLINGVQVETYTQTTLPDTIAYNFTESSCNQGVGAEQNTFYVKLEAVNPCGTSSATVGPITVNKAPTAVIGMTMPPNLCPGAMITFSDQSTGAGAVTGSNPFDCDDNTNPTWSVSPTNGVQYDPNDVYDAMFPVKFTQAGTYIITLTVFNANNSCGSNMITKTIVIAEPPLAQATAEVLTVGDCAPKKIKFVSQSLNTTQVPAWQVLLPSGAAAPTNAYHFEPPTTAQSVMPIIIFDLPGSYTVRLTITNPCGNDIWTYPVTVTAQPTITVVIPAICEGAALNLLANQVTAQANGTTITAWSWNFGTNATPSQSNILLPQGIIWSTPGTYTVTVTATNACGPSTVTTTVNILSKPVVSPVLTFSGSQTCVPSQVVFTQTVQAGVTYVRQVFRNNVLTVPAANNPNVEYVNGNASSATAILKFKTFGTYRVEFGGTNNCGSANYVWEHTFYQAPTAPIPTSTPFCNTAEINFDQNYLTGFNNGGDATTSYQWIFEGATPPVSNQQYPGSVQWSGEGSYNVAVTATNNCGTINTSSTVVINVQKMITFGTIPTPICYNSVPFNLNATPGPGTFSGTGITNSVQGTFNPASAGPGTHLITYRHGPVNCESTGTISITVLPSDIIDIGPNLTLCKDSPPLPLTGIPDGGTFTGNGVVNNIFYPNLANINANSIEYLFVNTNTCSTVASKIISVVGQPGISGIDTVLTCDITAAVNLATLGGFSFTPSSGGTTTWSGTGVNSNGLFTSPGIGVYPINVQHTIPPMCDSVKTFFVKVVALTVADAGNDTTLCLSQVSYTLPGTPAGKWLNLAGQIVNNPLILIEGSNKYVYILNEGTPCESRDTLKITVIGNNATNAGPDRSICETAFSLALPTQPPLFWTGPSINGSVIDIQALNPGNYAYTITNPNLPLACQTDIMMVTIAPQPNGGFTLSADTACIGQIITLFPIANNVQYEVNWGDGTPISNSLNHIYAEAGPYTITLTVKTFSGTQVLCTNYSDLPIWIVAPPQVFDFTMDNDMGCGPLIVQFTNHSVAENGTYQWDFGNGMIFNGFLPGPITFAQGIEDTIYTVKLRLITKCDTLEMTKFIKVLPKPKARFGYSYPLPCSGNSIAINITSVGNPVSNFLYTSQGAVIPVNIGQLYYLNLFTDSLPRVVDIWLITSNDCGVDTFLQQVTVLPPDVSALINIVQDSTTICPGENIVLKSVSTPGALLHWKDLTTGETFIGDSIILNYPMAGEYFVVLYAEGCGYDSSLVKLRVRMPPFVGILADLTGCPGSPISITVSATASTLTTLPDGTTTSLKNLDPIFNLPTGNYTVSTIATDQYGCTNTAEAQFFLGKQPEWNINPLSPGCTERNVTLTASGSDSNSITWYIDGHSFNGSSVLVSVEQPGQYPVVAISKSNDGCPDTLTLIQYIVQSPIADFSDSIVERCSPAKVLYINNSQHFTSAKWVFSDQTTVGVNPYLKTYLTGEDAWAMLIASNEDICFDTLQKDIYIPQTPESAAKLIRHCTRDSGYTLLILHNPGAGFNISLFGQDTTWVNDYRINQLQPGKYDLEIVSPEDCIFDTTLVLPLIAELMIALPNDTVLLLGDDLIIPVDYNQNDLDFQWSPSLYIDDNMAPTLYTLPFKDIQYTVTVTNAIGCTKADDIFIRVLAAYDSLVFVPNAFTPGNENGINDFFGIRSLNNAVKKLLYLKIYDLNGALVFSVKECPVLGSRFDKGEWDGTFRGNKAEAGPYKVFFGIEYIDGHQWHDQSELLLIR